LVVIAALVFAALPIVIAAAVLAALTVAVAASVLAALAVVIAAPVVVVVAASLMAAAVVIALRVSGRRRYGCSAQRGQRRYEGSFHIEAPSASLRTHPRIGQHVPDRLNGA
jgi:hypothetical protein